MTEAEFLKLIEVDDRGQGEFIDGVYTIKLKTSNDFSAMFTALDYADDNYREISVDREFSTYSNDGAMMLYQSKEFELKLSADFNTDDYKLEVRRK